MIEDPWKIISQQPIKDESYNRTNDEEKITQNDSIKK